MENNLELQQISKTYAKSNFTLDKVSFSLPYGSILGFVGENGSGKTTTIGCILNTIMKDSGTVKLFGKEMLDTDTDMREKIGVVYDGMPPCQQQRQDCRLLRQDDCLRQQDCHLPLQDCRPRLQAAYCIFRGWT